MGSRSKSKTSNTNKNFNIVNNNTGSKSGGGGNALTDNLNAVESELTFGDITLTDQGAIEGAVELGKGAFSLGSETIRAGQENVALAYEDTANSRDFAAMVAGEAADQFQRTTETALQRNSENVKQALGFARDSERSDGALTLEAMAPYGLAAVVLIAFILLIRGKS